MLRVLPILSLLVTAGAPSPLANASEPGDHITFPLIGGAAAYDRLLGHVATQPHRFVHSLNRVLLEQVDRDHDWKQVARRKELMELVLDLAKLDRRFGRAIELSGSKEGQKLFEQLCDELGYTARWKRGEWTLLAKSGDGATRGQRLARALGWDLAAIGTRAAEEPLTLELPVDTVELPLSEAEWRAITGRPTTDRATLAGPLEEVIRDQRLGFVLEGRRRLSAETLEALDEVGWNWLYRHGQPFMRYAAALRVEEGELVLPGGASAERAWATLLGTSPGDTVTFLRDLLDNRGARGAFLLHALSYQPDETVAFYIGAGDSATADESRFGRQVFRRIDDTTSIDFDAVRGGDLGFGTLVRSLPLDPEKGVLRLPGGPGLRYVAIRSADAPKDREALRRAVQRGRQRQLDEIAFLLSALTEQNDVLGVKRSALPRLIRTANLFGGREELLTPENVLLLARISDTAPAALPALELLEPRSAETVTDYLLAVAHLESLAPSVDSELLIAQFQGGVEWIAAMALAERVAVPELERFLQSWSRLHQGASSPYALAGRQLEWIVDLVAALPDAPDGAPGRDAEERRLIHALTAAQPGLVFEYDGIEYESRREEQLGRALAGHLERQGIPSAGELARAARRFADLGAAVAGGSIEQARSISGELAALISGWGGSETEPEREVADLWPRVMPVDRGKLLRELDDVARAKSENALRRRDDSVQRALEAMARELRPFLLAPAYLVALGDEDNVYFEDPALVRKHLILRSVTSAVAVDTAFGGADVVADAAGLGAHVRGPVAAVPLALAEFSGAVGAGAYLVRDRVWFQDLLRTRWHRISPRATRLVSTLVDAGRDVIARASAPSDGSAQQRRAVELVGARVPLARIEAQRAEAGRAGDRWLFSPSEELMVGLAVAERDQGARGSLLGEEAARGLAEAIDAAGDDWREELRHAGAGTPALNGRSEPWVGDWPPYELLENERLLAALIERTMLDLRFATLAFLGRHSLPGEPGEDLMRAMLRDATSNVELESLRDWEGHLEWLNRVEDDRFDRELRTLFAAGRYSARGF